MTKYSRKKQFLEELGKTWGIVTTACERVGITRQTYYKWLGKDEKFKKAVKEIQEKLDDFYEAQFIKLVAEKNDKAILQAVKTRLKHRGYADKLELEHSGSLNLDIIKKAQEIYNKYYGSDNKIDRELNKIPENNPSD